MASGQYVCAMGVMNGGIVCPSGKKTILNSGAIQLPNLPEATGIYIFSQILAVEMFFTSRQVPTQIELRQSVLTPDLQGKQAANDGVMILYDYMLAKYKQGDLLYLQQFYNLPTSVWPNDKLGFAMMMQLQANTRYVFALYLQPTGGEVTIGSSMHGTVGGGQTVYLTACGPLTNNQYPVGDNNGGVKF